MSLTQFSPIDRISSMVITSNLSGPQGEEPLLSLQNFLLVLDNHSSTFFLKVTFQALLDTPLHSHTITIFGERDKTSRIPSRHSPSILPVEIKAKSIGSDTGDSNLSIVITLTFSACSSGLKASISVYTLALGDSRLLDPTNPFPSLLLQARGNAVAMFPSLFRYRFFRRMLWIKLEGSRAYSLPSTPAILPRTTASRPICAPALRRVFPGLTNLAMFLSLIPYQVPQLLIFAEMIQSLTSMTRSTWLQMVGTRSYRSDKENFLSGLGGALTSHCMGEVCASAANPMKTMTIAIFFISITNLYKMAEIQRSKLQIISQI